jgi:hypothetical protein
MEHTISGQECADILTALKVNGYLRLPGDHPVLSQLLDSRVVKFRPFYEKEDDQNVFLQTINTKKQGIKTALERNDFPGIMKLALAIQEISTAITDHVWVANVSDEVLDQWIDMFQNDFASVAA